jgi:hypothetical protein
MKTHCHFCGQLLPEIRLGVRLTPLKARIYDLIHRAGKDGIASQDIKTIVYEHKKRVPKTIRTHINQINDRLEETNFKIKYSYHLKTWILIKLKVIDVSVRSVR